MVTAGIVSAEAEENALKMHRTLKLGTLNIIGSGAVSVLHQASYAVLGAF
jgi:hypothetical protein